MEIAKNITHSDLAISKPPISHIVFARVIEVSATIATIKDILATQTFENFTNKYVLIIEANKPINDKKEI